MQIKISFIVRFVHFLVRMRRIKRFFELFLEAIELILRTVAKYSHVSTVVSTSAIRRCIICINYAVFTASSLPALSTFATLSLLYEP